MNKDLLFAEQIFQGVLGKKPTRVKTGYGSFITIDFGKDITTQIKTRTGLKTQQFGEWHLWVYMCAWRIDKDKKPFLGSNDSKELIQLHINEIEKRILRGVKILNEAFDAKFTFGEDMELFLFSFNTKEHEQWMFFTPDNKVLTAGPGDEWSYEDSNKA
jgi:hypothetical protein